MLYTSEGGRSAKIAVVGREGLVGIALFMGGESTPSRAVVQSAGQGLRIDAPTLRDDFSRGGPVMRLLLRYSQALITQMVQTAACNQQHSLDQRRCRMLLLSLDRLQSSNVGMTEELIADMLAVPGDAATQCAIHMQQIGFIRLEQGRITVLDRPGLEKRTCNCYAAVKREYDRLLPEDLAV